MPKFDIKTTIVVLSFLGFGSIGSIFGLIFKAYDWHSEVNQTIERQNDLIEAHTETLEMIEELQEEKQVLIKAFNNRLKKDSIRTENIMHWMRHYDQKYHDGLYYYLNENE